jgi:hypothetical protein
MTCPDRNELIEYREREASERRAGELREHVAGCPACQARLDALTRLIDDLRAPVAVPGPHAVAHMMRRLAAPARPPRRAWPPLAAFATAALAALALMIVRPWRSDDGTFTPRGGGPALAPGHVTAEAIAREVGTTLFTLAGPDSRAEPPLTLAGPDGRAEPLAAGARVAPATAYVVGYRNLSRAVALHALVFAVDAAHDVHWLYPAYTRADDDPEAIALPPTDTTRLLAETVVLDGVPPGPLHVITIIGTDRLRVSAIEPLRGDQLAASALQRRFPSAAITEQLLEVSP